MVKKKQAIMYTTGRPIRTDWDQNIPPPRRLDPWRSIVKVEKPGRRKK